MKTPLRSRYLALFFLLVFAISGPAVAQEADEWRPGLVAQYRSAADVKAVLSRIDAKPSFSLGHSSLHPRLPPGEFEVLWTGVIHLQESGPITFDAFLCGELKVEVDGVVVLEGRGERETARVGPGGPLNRRPGRYSLKVRYRSLP